MRVPKGPCTTCGRAPKAVRLVITKGGRGNWVCRPCAEMFRQLAFALTGKHSNYEALPKVLRVLR